MEETINISEIQEVEILDIADIKTRVTKIIYKAINIYIAKLKIWLSWTGKRSYIST